MFSLSRRIKLKNMKKGVSVHIIEPGFYKTEIINPEITRKLVEKGIERIPKEKRKGLDEEYYVNQCKYFYFQYEILPPSIIL